MITYTPTNTRNGAALIIGSRLQSTLNYLHNTAQPFGVGGRSIRDLDAARTEAITLWHLLWVDFAAIDNAEADRLRQEIASAYENAAIRIRSKRGRTTTAS